jgi:hypothetical protein
MWYSQTSTSWRAYIRVVVSRSVRTTLVLWIHRMILATMQAELALWPTKHVGAQRYSARLTYGLAPSLNRLSL